MSYRILKKTSFTPDPDDEKSGTPVSERQSVLSSNLIIEGGKTIIEHDPHDLSDPEEPIEKDDAAVANERLFTEDEFKDHIDRALSEADAKYRKELEAVRADAFNEGKQKGFAEGREEGLQQGLKESDQIKTRFTEFMNSIEESWEKMAESVEHQIVLSACALCRHIIMECDYISSETLIRILEESSDSITGKKSLVIRVNPREHEIVSERAPELFPRFAETGEIRVVADRAITPGGCTLEAHSGKIDATVERRFEELIARIMEKTNED